MKSHITEAMVCFAEGLDQIARGLRHMVNHWNTGEPMPSPVLYGELGSSITCAVDGCNNKVSSPDLIACDKCRVSEYRAELKERAKQKPRMPKKATIKCTCVECGKEFLARSKCALICNDVKCQKARNLKHQKDFQARQRTSI